MGWLAAPIYQLRLLPFSFLFLPWFASLAFCFAVSSSPPFLPAGALEGRALLPGAQRRRVERGGVEEPFRGGGVSTERPCVGGSHWILWQRFEDTQEKGGSAWEGSGWGVKDLKDSCPGSPLASTLCPSDWEAVLSFPPRGWGGSYVEEILSFFPPSSFPFITPPHPAQQHTPFRAVAHWFLGC